ncbi:uncharacterized protein LOC135124492 isoform X2 [Zophobas morio]|uniref:uncharacterized protein LOC135124492 isoform X2 n=1 Tax=Zophobas morio TaxID=2755281 RepID=UPI00308295CC
MIVVLMVLFLVNCHECDPVLAKVKNQLSRKIDQSLYKYYDLQAQAKTNHRQIKKIVNKVHPSALNECYVDDKLGTLYGIILEYRRLLSGVTYSGYNFQQIDDYFEKTRSEIEQNNARCIAIIKRFCS